MDLTEENSSNSASCSSSNTSDCSLMDAIVGPRGDYGRAFCKRENEIRARSPSPYRCRRDGVVTGDLVERSIDGLWFPAKVVGARMGKSGRTLDIRYLDDDNEEADVPVADLRRCAGDGTDAAKASGDACQGCRESDDQRGNVLNLPSHSVAFLSREVSGVLEIMLAS
ncbi:unnamed protein product [Phaeothamnion confervicola]